MERSGREFKREAKAEKETEKQMRGRNWKMKKGMPRKGCHKRYRGLSQSDMGHLFASALPSKSPWVVSDKYITAKKNKDYHL